MDNRRAFVGLLFALALSHTAAGRQNTFEAGPERLFERNYTATAHVSFLSVPIFSRSGVGFGFASTSERVTAGVGTTTLRFLSGSKPERAGGLNRFGFIEESVEERAGSVTSANYFGLITANKEESFVQAKAALETTSQAETPFVAAQAVIGPGRARWSVRHMLLPASYQGANAEGLLKRIRAEFEESPAGPHESSETSGGETLGTFLYSLRQAMRANDAAYAARFAYNGKLFKLNTSKKADAKTGEDLQRAGVTRCPECIRALTGTIVNEKTNEATNFRLWFENGSPDYLPLRFEFKPKGYLKLVFDAERPLPHGAEQALNQGGQR